VPVQAKKLLGLLTIRERWGLSRRGWLTLLLGVLSAVWWLILNIHPFLALTHRVPCKVLVVEGWIHIEGVDAAVREFKNGHYEQVFTTGGPVEGIGPFSSPYDTEAWQSARLLREAGIPAASLQSVPSLFVGRDRTYNSAMALRDWFREHHTPVTSFNVLTENCHARRTHLLFQEAFGSSAEIGIISVPNPDYDGQHWWRYSEGVRTVIDESIAYLYAKFLFWPDKQETETGMAEVTANNIH
jgi:hypothetical protein